MNFRLIIPLLFFLTLFMHYGCSDDDPMDMDKDPEPECRDSFPSDLDVRWVKALNQDTIKDVSNHLGIVYGQVYCQSLYRIDNTHSHFLLNSTNGNEIWHKQIFAAQPSFTDGPYMLSDGDFIMHNTFSSYVFDGQSGSLIDKFPAPSDSAMQGRIAVYDDIAYRVTKPKSTTRYAKIEALHPESISKETIFYLHRDQNDGYHPTFESIQKFNASGSGDELLAWLMLGRNNAQGTSKVDLYVYNLTTNSMQYHHEDVTESGSASIYGLTIQNGRAYIQGTQKVYCYDIKTGETSWDPILVDNLSIQSNLIVTNGYLIINPEDEKIIGRWAGDGTPRWQKGSRNGSYDFSDPTKMIYNNGHVYFGSSTTDRLSCLSIYSGTVKWNDFSPFAEVRDPCEAGFNTQIALDSDEGLLYAHDNFFVMAIELAE